MGISTHLNVVRKMLKDEAREKILGPFIGNDGTAYTFKVAFWKSTKYLQQPAHFSVTHTSDYSCGVVSDRLLGLFSNPPKELKQLLKLDKWHLWDVKNGAMHYVENAKYWYKLYLVKEGKLLINDQDPYGLYNPEKHKDDALKHFKSTVAFGEIKGESLPNINLEHILRPTNAEKLVLDNWNALRKQAINKIYYDVDQQIQTWCENRFPAIMQLFEKDMVEFWGPEILV